MFAYKSILCATDFSQNCSQAFKRAAELARAYGAKLTLMHVVEYFPEQRSNEWIEREGEDPKDFEQRKAQEGLDKLAGQVDIDVDQEIRFTNQSAKHEIIRYADEHGIDLIVVASHGQHGILPEVGSTTHALTYRAPCDVLVVRATE